MGHPLNNKPFIVHCTYGDLKETTLVKKFADDYLCNYLKIGIKQEVYKNADSIKYANFAVMWNGLHYNGPLITKICELRGIPSCYIEWGILPQVENFFVDPTGFCGRSILCRDLSWVTKKDMDNMYEKRESLQKQYEINDRGYILVPLQIENDTQILYNSPYNNMEEFVSHVKYMYPNNRIIVKNHPKTGNYRVFDGVETAEKEGASFLELAAGASLVVSVTSSALYEAGVLGVPVLAVGDHPIRSNRKDKLDKILAGAMALNINRSTGSIKSVLDRFNYKPIL
jgi:hypothetical protein